VDGTADGIWTRRHARMDTTERNDVLHKQKQQIHTHEVQHESATCQGLVPPRLQQTWRGSSRQQCGASYLELRLG
jgi:hypothetical protein